MNEFPKSSRTTNWILRERENASSMVQLRLINSGAEEGSNFKHSNHHFGSRGHQHQRHGNYAKAPASSSSRSSSHSAPDSSVPARTLTYTIVHVSSQDENFPASELNKGILGCGWQSSRFCPYPQELVVELEYPSNIANLQLLSHEYKITSKVEIFVSSESFWVNSEEFIDRMKPLGFVSLDPNDKTRHQARELKNINLDCNAAVIRLVLHKCFANTLNVYCQVGIIALSITGEPSVGQFVKPVSTINSIVKDSWMEDPSSDNISDSLTRVDSITAQAIVALQKEKSKAVQEENYIVANKLKALIEKRRVTGRRIKELELQKQAAVQLEDYDCAKTCKLEIEKVRESINATDDLTIDRSTQTSKELDKPEEWDVTNIVKDSNVERNLRDVSTQTSESEVARQVIELSAVRGSQFSENPMKEEQYTYDSTVANSVLTLSQIDPSFDEILSPEPLSEVLLKEMEPMLMLIDRYHLDCIFSKHWQLRDKGLVHLGKQLDSPGIIEPLSTFRVIVKVLVRALNDKVSNVFQTSLQALHSFINRYSSEVSNKEIHTAATDIIAVLVEKLGHTHVRTREATAQALLFIATIKEIGLNVVAPILLKPPKTQAAWKPILGRLQLLLIAVPAFGLQPHHPLGFPIEALMFFITQSFGSPNGHVRTAAVRVTVEAYKLMGPPLEKFLKGVKPAIHEVLIEKFEKVSSDIHKTQKTTTTNSCSENTIPFHKKNTAKCMNDANLKRYDKAFHDISNVDPFYDHCVEDKMHCSQVHTLSAMSTSNT